MPEYNAQTDKQTDRQTRLFLSFLEEIEISFQSNACLLFVNICFFLAFRGPIPIRSRIHYLSFKVLRN